MEAKEALSGGMPGNPGFSATRRPAADAPEIILPIGPLGWFHGLPPKFLMKIPVLRLRPAGPWAALCFAFSSLMAAAPAAKAATYPATSGSQAFSYVNGSLPGTGTWNDGTALSSTLVGDPQAPVASVQVNALRLAADGVSNTTSSFKIPDMDPGLNIASLAVNFTLKLSATGTAGQGVSLNFGDIPASDGDGELGWALPGGLVVAWETFVDTAAGATQGAVVVYANRVVMARYPVTFLNDPVFRTVALRWDSGGLDLTYAGTSIVQNLPVPGFAPGVGDRVAFSARTGAATSQEIAIDSLQITTTAAGNIATGGPVIAEFAAANNGSYGDEDLGTPDWIELVNGSSTAAPLNGWFLTNDPALLTKWPLPAITLTANQYRVVFASGKNRGLTTGQLHTNFVLEKDGGYLALVRPDLSIASEYTYGPQADTASFGEAGTARERGYLETPTPGKKNVSLIGGAPSSEEVVFSREGGLLADATPVALTIAAPVQPGAVVRYSLNQTLPTEISPAYLTPFSLTASTTVRARVFQPGRLPGPVSSRTFLKLDSSLTNYNGTGQPFSSNLPVVVLDSFGVAIDGTTDPGGARPFRPGYSVTIAPEAATGRTSLAGPIDFQGRCGAHVRGESSSGFGQKSYAWEIWTNENKDKDAPLLGLPAESDWALHGPWSDKSLMRNYLVYSTFGESHQDWFAPRTRFVEVFFNQEPNQPVSFADYRGIYLLVEKIKRSKNRADLEKINPLVTDPILRTGGYIFKTDKASPGSTAWTTSRGISIQSADPESLPAVQQSYLAGYLNSFEAALNGASFAHPTTGYAAWIDVPSFIDWQWAVEISKQIDGYVFSTYYHKDRGGKMKAGPLWDFNISLGNANYAEGEFRTGWNYDTSRTAPLAGGLWFSRLHADPNYRVATFDRYWELRQRVWGTAAIQARIEAVSALLRDGSETNITNNTALSVQTPAARHFRKYKILGTAPWPNPAEATSRTTFQAEVSSLKQWITDRLTWMDNQFRLGSSAMRPPVMTRTDAGNGTVQLALSPFAGMSPGFNFPGGILYYTVNGTDPRPISYALPTVQATPVTILAEYGQARWLVPTAENGGAALPFPAWTGVADPPNAAAWTAGPLGVGFDTGVSSSGNPTLYHVGGSHLNDNSWTGGPANLQSAMLNTGAAAFLRMPFTLTADQQARLVTLKVKVRYDDGFVVYVNGVEAARQNVLAATVPAWNSTADATPGNFSDTTGATGITLDISHVIGQLQTGSNMLAVLALNKTAADSDFLCAPSLTGSLGVRPVAAQPAIAAEAYSVPLQLAATTTVKARLFVPGTGMWSPLANSTFVVAAVPATPENLVVSEINYAPLPPTAGETAAGATGANDFEFIELLNTSSDTVDLTNVRLGGAVQEFNFSHGAPATLTVPPGGRVVVCGNLTAFRKRYPDPSVPVAGAFSGNLNNAGETLILLDKNGAVLWSFAYDDVAPWPAVDDGYGSSIVLNQPARHPAPDPALGANWRPSAARHGAPGAADSLPFTLAPAADDDGDGVANYLEYLFGTDPASASSHASVAVMADRSQGPGDPYPQFEFPLNLAADGYALTWRTSQDLVSWEPASPAPALVAIRRDATGAATAVWRAGEAATPANSPRYFRLVATPP